MKFAVVIVVVLALAVGIESNGGSYGARIAPLSYPLVRGVYGGANLYSTPSLYGGLSYYDNSGIYGTPITGYAAHGGFVNGGFVPLVRSYGSGFVAPAPVVAAPVVTGEGSYVAQTRGSVHVAPLPGHANSAASINLQPAPGTY